MNTTVRILAPLFLLAFLLTACHTAQKYVESGDYDSAIDLCVRKLKGKSKKKLEYVQGLELAFRKAQARDIGYDRTTQGLEPPRTLGARTQNPSGHSQPSKQSGTAHPAGGQKQLSGPVPVCGNCRHGAPEPRKGCWHLIKGGWTANGGNFLLKKNTAYTMITRLFTTSAILTSVPNAYRSGPT